MQKSCWRGVAGGTAHDRASAFADRGDQPRIKRTCPDDALGQEEQRSSVGVEVALLAEPTFQLNDHFFLDARVLLRQVAI